MKYMDYLNAVHEITHAKVLYMPPQTRVRGREISKVKKAGHAFCIICSHRASIGKSSDPFRGDNRALSVAGVLRMVQQSRCMSCRPS